MLAVAFVGIDLHTNGFTGRRLEADGSKQLGTFQLLAAALDRFCLAVPLPGMGNAATLAAYLGIVAGVSRFDSTDNRGRIAKRRDKLMRTTLVQCTPIAIRYSGDLNTSYRRIKEHRSAGRTIIATARKLLAIIFRPHTGRWVFKNFPNFIIAGRHNHPAGQSS